MTKKIQPTDLLAVNRANTNYSISAKTVGSKLRDDDYMVVLRGTTHYKVAGADIKSDLTPAGVEPTPGQVSSPGFLSGSGTQGDPFIMEPINAAPMGSSGISTHPITVGGNHGELVVFVDANSATNGARFDQPLGAIDENGQWSGYLYYSDTPATTVEPTPYTGLLTIGSVYIQWVVTQYEGLAAIVNSVTLTNTDSSGGRWHDEIFQVQADITEGIPETTKAVKATITGNLILPFIAGTIDSIGTGNINIFAGTVNSGGMNWSTTPISGQNSGYAYDGQWTKPQSPSWANAFDSNPGSRGAEINTGSAAGVGDAVTTSTWYQLNNPLPFNVEAQVELVSGTDALTWFVGKVGQSVGYSNLIKDNPGMIWCNTPAGTNALMLFFQGAWTTSVGGIRGFRKKDTQEHLSTSTPTNTITLNNIQDLDKLTVGTEVIGLTSGAKGTVSEINGAVLSIPMPSGTFQQGEALRFYTKVDSTTGYATLGTDGVITNLVPSDPGFQDLTMTHNSSTYSGYLTFPNSLNNTNLDTVIPASSSLTVDVQATNAKGSASATSNTVTP